MAGHYGPEEWWYPDGTSAANVRAAVFEGDQSTLASIFTDVGLTIPLANPTTTDGSGMLEFYAADGDYWVFVGDENYGDSVLTTLGPAVTGAVLSVNGQTGVVVLGASDVGAQPIATINAKGDLYAGTGNDATTRRSVGTDGQVLTADSSDPTGLSWQAGGGGGAVASVNGQTGVVVLTASDVGADPAGAAAAAQAAAIAASLQKAANLADLSNAVTARSNLGLGNSAVLNTGTTAGTVATGDDSRIVGAQQRVTLTTKGDLYVATAAATTTRQPVGADGQILTADSAQSTGVKWAVPPSAPVTSVNGQTGVVVLGAADVGADPVGSAAAAALASQPLATIDVKGDLYAGTGNNATARRSVGVDGTVLTALASDPTGLTWAMPAAAPVTSVNGQTGVVVLNAGDVGADPAGSAAAAQAASQPLDSDLTAIAGLAPTNDDIIQRKAGAWANRSVAQYKVDLAYTASDVGAQPIGTIDAKGDLYAGTGDNATTRQAVGTNTQVLRANSANSTGLEWYTLAASDVGAQPLDADLTAIAGLTPTNDDVMQYKSGAWANRTIAQVKTDLAYTAAQVGAIANALVDAKGDIITATANDTPARLAVGTNGQLLSANSAQSTGLEWVAAPAAGIPATILDAKGDLIAATAADTAARLAVGTNGHVLSANSAQSTGLEWIAAPVDAGAQQRSTLTTKGDLYVATASATTARQAVGTDGFGIVADSTLTNGLGWKVRSSVGLYPRSSGYSPAGAVGTTRSSKTATLDVMFLTPFYLLIGGTLSSLAFEVSGAVALAVVRLGIYGSDSAMLPTGSPLADYGTVLSATTGTKTAAVSTAFTPGLYWAAVVGQTVAPTLRFSAGQSPWVANATFPSGSSAGWNNAFAQTGVSGALPTIGSFTDSDAPLLGLKF